MSHWKIYDYFEFKWPELEERPGCYVIYLDGQLSYIGQASNIKARVSSYRPRFGYGNTIFHLVGGKEGICKQYLVKVRYSSRIGDWAMREIRLIKRLQPPLNNTHGGKKKRATPIKRNKNGQEIIYLEPPSDHDIMIDIVAERMIEQEKFDKRYEKWLYSRMRSGK